MTARKRSDEPDRQQGDYDVGYGKPPVHSQFKPGQSGNPKGRPKGTRNFKNDLEAELSERLPVTINGREIRYSKQQIMIKAQVARAMKGDTKAAALIISHLADIVGLNPPDLIEPRLIDEDQAILDAYVARLAARQKGSSNDGEDGNV